jgi:hypothetical protein
MTTTITLDNDVFECIERLIETTFGDSGASQVGIYIRHRKNDNITNIIKAIIKPEYVNNIEKAIDDGIKLQCMYHQYITQRSSINVSHILEKIKYLYPKITIYGHSVYDVSNFSQSMVISPKLPGIAGIVELNKTMILLKNKGILEEDVIIDRATP